MNGIWYVPELHCGSGRQRQRTRNGRNIWQKLGPPGGRRHFGGSSGTRLSRVDEYGNAFGSPTSPTNTSLLRSLQTDLSPIIKLSLVCRMSEKRTKPQSHILMQFWRMGRPFYLNKASVPNNSTNSTGRAPVDLI
jgi:hypothetical protein